MAAANTSETKEDIFSRSPFIRLKDFSHLVFLLGLEWDVGGLHQPVLGPVLVDAGRFRKHLVLLVV